MTHNFESLFTDILRAFARALAPYIPPKKPGKFTLSVTSQSGPETMIVTATLPAKTASDVTTFTLHYTIDSGVEVSVDSTGDPIEFNAPVGATVVAAFTESDASGNVSPRNEPITLLIVDSISPPVPGAFTLTVTGQEA